MLAARGVVFTMATSTPSDDAGECVRVLVVDPDRMAAEHFADALEFAEPSLSVETVNGGDAALDRLAEESFDCVVCEHDLETDDGLSLLEQATNVAPGVRGIVHTTEDDPAIAGRAWEQGFAYARKGHDLDRYDVIARHIVGEGETFEAAMERAVAVRWVE
jgi:DNA-binding NtrC family response regulator